MTPKQIKTAKTLRAEGKTYAAIASILGCSRETVRNHIVTEKRTVEDRKSLTKEAEKDVIKRIKEGESQAAVAKQYGVSDTTIRNTLKRYGAWERKVNPKTEHQIKLEEKYLNNSINKLINTLPIKDKEEICNSYQGGTSQKSLSKKYKIHSQVLRGFLLRMGVKLRTYEEAIGSIPTAEHSSIINRYKAGEGSTTIAKSYNCNDSQIVSILNEHNVPLRKTQIIVRLFPYYESILRRYKTGESMPQIAKDFDVCWQTIKRILVRQGEKIRSMEETKRVISSEDRDKVCNLYREGKSYSEIAREFNCSVCAVVRVLKLGNVKPRSISESRWPNNGIPAELEIEVCERYKAGEPTRNLVRDYQVEQSSIFRLLKRKGYEVRSQGNLGDSVQHALDGSSNFKFKEETSFYIFDIKNHPGYLKPGITNSIKDRSSKRWYKDLLYQKVLPSRVDAYFLEQAILNETVGFWDCPDEIQKDYKWGGRDEVRLMEVDDLIAIFEYYYQEYLELGPWEFAAIHLPANIITGVQRVECLEKSKIYLIPE